MRSKYLKYFFFVIPLLVFTSCSEDPSTAGIDQLNNDLVDVLVYDTQLDTVPIQQTSEVFLKDQSYYSSSRNLLGTADDNTSSSVLFRFAYYYYLSDSIKSDINSGLVTVTSAYLDVYPEYYYPTKSFGSFDFDIHPITANWYVTSFTKAGLDTAKPDMAKNYKIGNARMVDTLMRCDFNNTDMFTMLQASTDTATATTEYGFMLSPKPGLNKIIGFGSSNSSTLVPVLTVVIQKTTGNTYIDTLKFSPEGTVHVFTSGNIPSTINKDQIAVRGGVSVQSKITFDLTKLPQNAVINKAELILTPVDNLSKIAPDSANINLYADCPGKDSATTASLSGYTQILKRSGSIYTGEITYFVQRWLKPVDNQGVILSLANGGYGADMIVLKGSTAPVLERPRLKITYTIKK